jgi:hypothetical protein
MTLGGIKGLWMIGKVRHLLDLEGTVEGGGGSLFSLSLLEMGSLDSNG